MAKVSAYRIILFAMAGRIAQTDQTKKLKTVLVLYSLFMYIYFCWIKNVLEEVGELVKQNLISI